MHIIICSAQFTIININLHKLFPINAKKKKCFVFRLTLNMNINQHNIIHPASFSCYVSVPTKRISYYATITHTHSA